MPESSREMLFETSNGPVALAFTDNLLTFRHEPHGSGSTAADTLAGYFFSWSDTHSEVPIRNVIAATVSGRRVELSYLDHTKKHGFEMKQFRGNVAENDIVLATEWCRALTQVAYRVVSPASPAKFLKVLINPYGGPGKAHQIFTQKVEPILRAAGCTLDVTLTTRAGHAFDIARSLELTYDALVIVSGDGLIHEVLNGFAKHATPEEAFSIPIAPIPAGSGNGLALNILGLDDGLDPCAAALNVLKGRPMKIDLFSFSQGDQTRISFMSQTVGLLADLDIGTEYLRWMGDLRFVLGYLWELVTLKTCEMELSINVVEQDKSRMADAVYARRNAAKPILPALASDVTPSNNGQADRMDSGNWVTFDKPILGMVAGKGPYACRSFMQLPVSHHDDGLIDIVFQDVVGRKAMIDGMTGAEIGRWYWFNTNKYFKVSAYRAKPLTAGASEMLVVDGERFPFEAFQIDVLHRLGTVLSPHPHYAPEFKVIDAEGNMRETRGGSLRTEL